MQGAPSEASIPKESERNGGRMSLRRKFANMLQYFNPFSTMPPQQDDALPERKRPRHETADAADAEGTASPDGKVGIAPTDGVTGAASLPSTGALRASIPRSAKRLWIEADADADADTEDTDTDSEDAQTSDTLTSTSHDDTDVVTVPASFPSAGTFRTRPRNWLPEEDAKLTEAVTELGNAWVAVAAIVPGRSVGQCRYRWVECLDPTINTGHWTPEEDEKLTDAVTQLGKDWVQVAAMVPGRSNQLCRKRWITTLEGRCMVCRCYRTPQCYQKVRIPLT
jgi:hypothetical protein